MYNELWERVLEISEYVAVTGATVRAAAKHFGVSKSTVHKDLTERLEKLDPSLYAEVGRVLEHNRQERHIRGGMATRIKYKNR